MSWIPKTLLDASIETRAAIDSHMGSAGKDVYKCKCGAAVVASRMVDVRHMDYDQDFACDGCWTRWERIGIMSDGTKSQPQDRREWQKRWLVAHSAPQSEVDKLTRLRPVPKYTKTRRV